MDSKNLTEQREGQKDLEKDSLFTISLIGVTIFGIIVLYKLLKRKRAVPSDPPPIIVKTGANSLMIQSKGDIEKRVSGFYYYIIDKFLFEIRGVRIKKATGTAEPDKTYEDERGLKIEIDLEDLNSTSDLNAMTVRAESDGASPYKDLVIQTNLNLQRRIDAPQGYRDFWVSAQNKRFRFRKITVINSKGETLTSEINNTTGDDYEIWLYGKLE